LLKVCAVAGRPARYRFMTDGQSIFFDSIDEGPRPDRRTEIDGWSRTYY
jgi:hypothetical protein